MICRRNAVQMSYVSKSERLKVWQVHRSRIENVSDRVCAGVAPFGSVGHRANTGAIEHNEAYSVETGRHIEILSGACERDKAHLLRLHQTADRYRRKKSVQLVGTEGFTILLATQQNSPSTKPEITPMIGPVTTIIRRGCPANASGVPGCWSICRYSG